MLPNVDIRETGAPVLEHDAGGQARPQPSMLRLHIACELWNETPVHAAAYPSTMAKSPASVDRQPVHVWPDKHASESENSLYTEKLFLSHSSSVSSTQASALHLHDTK